MFGFDDAAQLGLGAAGQIFQAVEGAQQKSEGEALAASNKRPKYAIPHEYYDSINNIRQLLNYKIPGYNTATDRLTGSTSQAVANAKEVGRNPSDILNTLGRANANENTGIQNLDIAGAQNYNNQNEAYRNALLAKVPAENLAFDYNENQPYQDRARKANALIGAGLQNENQGIQGGINTVGKTFTGQKQDQNHQDVLSLISKLYGGGGKPSLQSLVASMSGNGDALPQPTANTNTTGNTDVPIDLGTGFSNNYNWQY